MLGLTRGRLIAIAVAIVAGVAIGVGARFLMPGEDGRSAFKQTLVDPGIGGPFHLTDQNGQSRTDADFRGKLMLVEFGYTFCPDVCPLGLQLFADVLDQLGPDADKVQPIFITVDPARDTPAQIKDYVAHFSPRIVGLTGSEQDIAATARAYRVYYKLAPDHATNPNYSVDHSAILYLMDTNGRFITHFTHETPVDRVVATIHAQLERPRS
jgi:cytochrome oxidase Cu insertion factor (SCO1/SenC/PrrC family)